MAKKPPRNGDSPTIGDHHADLAAGALPKNALFE